MPPLGQCVPRSTSTPSAYPDCEVLDRPNASEVDEHLARNRRSDGCAFNIDPPILIVWLVHGVYLGAIRAKMPTQSQIIAIPTQMR